MLHISLNTSKPVIAKACIAGLLMKLVFYVLPIILDKLDGDLIDRYDCWIIVIWNIGNSTVFISCLTHVGLLMF